MANGGRQEGREEGGWGLCHPPPCLLALAGPTRGKAGLLHTVSNPYPREPVLSCPASNACFSSVLPSPAFLQCGLGAGGQASSEPRRTAVCPCWGCHRSHLAGGPHLLGCLGRTRTPFLCPLNAGLDMWDLCRKPLEFPSAREEDVYGPASVLLGFFDFTGPLPHQLWRLRLSP